MALSFTLRLAEGFYVGDNRWYVEAIEQQSVVLVGPNARRVEVSDQEAVELEPNVFVSEGFPLEFGCRLVLDAPRSILILRDELYERQRRPGASDDLSE